METRRSVKRKTARKDHCELLLAAATGCVMALSFIFINNLSTGYQQQNVDNLKTIKAEENVDKARVKYESDQQKQEERFQKILKEVQKEDEKQQQEQGHRQPRQLSDPVCQGRKGKGRVEKKESPHVAETLHQNISCKGQSEGQKAVSPSQVQETYTNEKINEEGKLQHTDGSEADLLKEWEMLISVHITHLLLGRSE